MYPTQPNPHTKIKILMIILVAFLFVIAMIPASNAYTDYSTSVSLIVKDTSLTSIQKNSAQAELFGWTESLSLYLTERTSETTEIIEDSETGEIITTTTTEPDIFTQILRTVGIAASPLPDEEGKVAWNAYLSNYMSNYRGSYTYK